MKPAEIEACVKIATVFREHAIAITEALSRAAAIASYGASASDWSDVDKSKAADELARYAAATAAITSL